MNLEIELLTINHRDAHFGMQSLMGGCNVQSQPNVDTYTFSKQRLQNHEL